MLGTDRKSDPALSTPRRLTPPGDRGLREGQAHTDRRRKIDQRVLANLLRLNLERAKMAEEGTKGKESDE